MNKFLHLLAVGNILSVSAALVVSYYIPTLAAWDYVKPTQMLFFALSVDAVIIVVLIVSLMMIIVRARSRRLFVVSLCLSLVCLFVNHVLTTGKKCNSMFLHELARRIDGDVGFVVLNNFFVKLQNDIIEGRQIGSPINQNTVPEPLRRLFKTAPAYGEVVFNNKEAYYMRINWGGPLFNWGVEVFGDIPEDMVRSGMISTEMLYTNTIVFIGK